MTARKLTSGFDHPWKLSSFYFFFFALVGGIAPFLPLYLASAGYNAIAVGQLMAIVMLTKLVAPNIWGWVADRTGQRLRLVRLGGFFSSLFFIGFIVVDGFWLHALFLILFSCFWNAILPQWEVITLYNLGAERARYSQIRLWGSVGFIVTVTGLGVFFEYFAISWLVWWLLALLCLMTLFGSLVRHQPITIKGGSSFSFIKRVLERDTGLFFLLAFLLQLSFGPYYTFLSLHLEDLGYRPTSIGVLWALGVLAEVALFMVMHSFIRRYSLKVIMLVCLFLTAFRWMGTAYFAHVVWALIFFQLLHAASFGGLHAASVEFVHRAFDARHSGQAQAMYSALSFGAGGGVGAWMSGLLVSAFDKSTAFFAGGLVAILAGLLLLMTWQKLSPLWGIGHDHH